MSMNPQDYQYRDDSGQAPIWEHKKKYRDKTPQISPEAYYSGHDMIQRRKKLFEFDQERPATFINKPLTRAAMRKKVMRNIKKKDIEGNNLALVTKFLNDVGKM